MAETGKNESLSLQAAADLQTFQYRIMRHSAANQCNVASDSGAAAAVGAIGVLLNKPNTNEAATVAYMGESKVFAGGAITVGRWVTTQGSGKLAHAASGDLVVGRALETAGAENELIRCLLFPPFRLGHVN